MMSFQALLYRFDDRRLFEMANLQTKTTGLQSIVFVSWRGNSKHGPRIKVSNIAGRMDPNDNFSITIENQPRVVGKCKLKNSDLDDIIDWVKLNKNHLIRVWFDGDSMDPVEIQQGFYKL